MTESKDNEEHDWEDEAELHLMDVCPLFTSLDSTPSIETLCITFKQDCYQNIGILSKEEHCILNQPHIRLLKEYYSERIMMEFFLDA